MIDLVLFTQLNLAQASRCVEYAEYAEQFADVVPYTQAITDRERGIFSEGCVTAPQIECYDEEGVDEILTQGEGFNVINYDEFRRIHGLREEARPSYWIYTNGYCWVDGREGIIFIRDD